jgi:thioredoxin 1
MSEIVNIISDSTYEQSVTNSDFPVLIIVWAPWCGLSNQINPSIPDIARELSGKINIYKCNIDDNPRICTKLKVNALPSLFLLYFGNVLDCKVGTFPKSHFVHWALSTIENFDSSFCLK